MLARLLALPHFLCGTAYHARSPPPAAAMGKKGQGRARSEGTEIKEKEILQAVVLADSFTQTFRPITLEVPKVRA